MKSYLIGALLISSSAIAQPVCKMATIRVNPDFPPQVAEICIIPDEQARIYGEIQRQREEQERQRQMLVPRIFQPFQPWRQ